MKDYVFIIDDDFFQEMRLHGYYALRDSINCTLKSTNSENNRINNKNKESLNGYLV